MNARILIVAAVLAVGVPQLYAATITVTSTNDSGPGTLRYALANAADGDTIDASGVTGTVLLISGYLLVTNSVSVIGPGPDLLAINGNSRSSVFVTGTNTEISISGLTLTNGLRGVHNDHATLTVSNCILSGNSASGIINDGSGGNAGLVVVDCLLSGNRAGEQGAGGGIFNNAESGTASVKILNSTLSGNSGTEWEYGGGGISNDGHGGTATIEIINSILTGNFSPGSGGGIYNGGFLFFRGPLGGTASVEIVNTAVIGNSVDGRGGDFNGFGAGIYNDNLVVDATLTVVNSSVSSNSGSSGGGIANTGSMLLKDSALSGNYASSGGGGIFNGGHFVSNSMMHVVGTTVSGNSAGYVGGIYNYMTGTMYISDSTISSNSALSVGGIWNYGVMQIVNSTLSVNSNLYNGGAILNYGTLEIGNSILNAGVAGVNTLSTFTSLGYNLSSDDGGGNLTGPGDIINTDPMLGPLQDNGGLTFTCALLPGSPAINAGDPNFTPPPDFDQRGPGFPRVAYGRIDIGAFEAQTLPDSDGDGVPDMFDQCPNTAPGAVVDSNGCSIAQLVPCAGPATGGTWKNHGQYVAAVVQEATVFLKAGLINRRQWAHIVTQAAWSRCGWNRHWDRDGDRDWSRAWDCDRDADWGRERR